MRLWLTWLRKLRVLVWCLIELLVRHRRLAHGLLLHITLCLWKSSLLLLLLWLLLLLLRLLGSAVHVSELLRRRCL